MNQLVYVVTVTYRHNPRLEMPDEKEVVGVFPSIERAQACVDSVINFYNQQDPIPEIDGIVYDIIEFEFDKFFTFEKQYNTKRSSSWRR